MQSQTRLFLRLSFLFGAENACTTRGVLLKRTIHRGVVSLLVLTMPTLASAAELVVPGAATHQSLAVEVPDSLQAVKDRAWQLVETDHPDVAIDAQVVSAMAHDGTCDPKRVMLVATVPPRAGAADTRRFELRQRADADADQGIFHFEQDGEPSLRLREGDRNVFVYNHGVVTGVSVPEKDPRRQRGCYVHPVWGISGEVLTDDFPKDHFHHHGIFWTWPHVRIGDKTYNSWARPDVQQRFVRWLCRETGPVAAVLAVENGWFVGDQKVMTERVWLRAGRTRQDQRCLDITLVFIPVDQAIQLQGAAGKSYGGLTMRFSVFPMRRDALVTVPGRVRRHVGDGILSREDLSNVRLPWADLSSEFPAAPGRSGAAVFVHPQHPDYPPSWLTRCYGPLCVGWPGVKPQTLEAGKPVRLDYRIWIHKTAVDGQTLDGAYRAYTTGTAATWQ